MQQQILIIKRGAMGDILMATPFIRQLKQFFPSSQISFLTTQSFTETLYNNPYIDKIITVKESFFSLKNILSTIGYILRIRNRYDYIFTLDKHYYFSVITSLFKGIRIGFAREGVAKLLLNKYIIYGDINRYHGLYYLDLLTALNFKPDYNDINLNFFKGPVTSDTQEFLKLNQLNNYSVVINSGGNNAYEKTGIRMLPPDKVLQLLIHLLKTSDVILLGGAIDNENYTDYLKKLNHPRLFNLAGKLRLSDSAHILIQAKKIYTTDCGAMHLAISQSCNDKMVCFFGPTNPNHVLPSNSLIKVCWGDEDIYDIDYALKGLVKDPDKIFFNKLNLDNFIE